MSFFKKLLEKLPSIRKPQLPVAPLPVEENAVKRYDPGTLSLSLAGITLIKRWEGCVLTAYKDGGGVWTIGYGSTGSHVKPTSVITKEEAEVLFSKDIQRYIKGVQKAVKVPLYQYEFDALVSLAYNIGVDQFKASTLVKLLNQSKYTEAAEQFLRWKYDNGKLIQGLLNRRHDERKMFLGL